MGKKSKVKKMHRNKLITKIMMPISALFLALSIIILQVLNFLPFIGDQYIGGATVKVSLAKGTEGFNADYYNLSAYTKEGAAQKSKDVCLQVAEEGFVLLKNNGTLPLKDTTKVNVFGWAFNNPVYGGTGSGSVNADTAITPAQGLADAGFVINPELQAKYAAWSEETGHTARPSEGKPYWTLPEMPITNETVSDAAKYSDTAIVWIARHGGEGQDEAMNMTTALNGETAKELGYNENKHYLELTDYEEAIFEALEANDSIKNIIVIINSSNAMELGELESDSKVGAILYAAAGGSTGFEAVGEILRGTVNPSGRMTDTYYANFKLDPTYQNFSDPSLYETTGPTVNYYGDDAAYVLDKEGNAYGYPVFVQYEEGIYLGYRYYETAYAYILENQGQEAADAWYRGWNKGKNVTAGSYTDSSDTGVVYPFGYGLSYTDFAWEILSYNEDVSVDGTIEVKVKVTNTGSVAGKDVVELFYTATYYVGGVEKAQVVLGAYEKTKIIEPGKYDTVTIKLAVEDMASYDEKHANSDGTTGCYVLDAGNYILSLRTDAHTVKSENTVLTYNVDKTVFYDSQENKRQSDKTVATNAFSEYFEGRSSNMTDLSRSNFGLVPGDGTFPTKATDIDRQITKAMAEGLANHTSNMAGMFGGITMTGTLDPKALSYIDENDKMPITGAKNGIQLINLRGLDYDDPMWDKFLDQFTVDEMEIMIGQGSFSSRGNTRLGVPITADNDGPSSIKWSGATGNQTSSGTDSASQAMPSEVVMACTWNVDLIEEVGIAIGTEGALNGVSGWYAPGLNMHRSPFGGRNFEYFSEDPVLAGTIAAAEISGAASKGVYAYVKHFVVNDQESYRTVGSSGNWEGHTQMLSFISATDDVTCSVFVSENALREIYLRAFELAIKNAKTDIKYISDTNGTVSTKTVQACTGVMSSFMRIGDTWCGANSGLLTQVLRNEWGFEGSVTSDASGQPYMSVDDAIYNGGDVMLAIGKLYLLDATKESASGVIAMRRAVHNLCFTKVNSNAMNNITPESTISYGLTSWQKLCYGLIVVTAAIFVLVWGIFIKNMVTKKKTKVVIDGHKTTIVEKKTKEK